MTKRPDLTWYTTGADPSAPTRLLNDEGRPAPGLATDAERALAALAAAVHATAWRLGERELRRLKALVGMQRWRR
jgi:hypothetical protein